MNPYVIHGGIAGSNRMSVVAKACWPNTFNLLKRAGLREGMKCLDLGCGAGDVTFEIAKLVGEKVRVVGMDMDPIKIEKAQKRAAEEKVSNTHFVQGNVFEWVESQTYDLIYVRFLLTHLPQRERLYPQLLRALNSGGVLIVEDVDFEGHVCFPPNHAFTSYVQLYQQVVLQRGGDPNLGRKLLDVFQRTGFQKIEANIVYPDTHLGKEMNLLTLVGISDALLEENLISKEELEQLTEDLKKFVEDPRSVASAARVFQTWGFKP